MGEARRLLVTGGRGFIAGSILTQAGASWEAHAQSRGPAPDTRASICWHETTLLDYDALAGLMRTVRPFAVIHTAAMASIDYCEAHPEETCQVNVDATVHLAALCAEYGARCLFCSTDNVFDGERGNYNEEDPVHPIHVYGASKVEAEQAVLALGPHGVVARLAVTMGLPLLGQGNAFLIRMLETLEAGKELGVPEEEMRTPIDVVTLGQALLELAGGEYADIIHLAGNERASRLHMARRLAFHMGHNPHQILPNDPTVLPGRAPRPRDISLDNTRARAILKTPMRGLDDGIAYFLQHARWLR